MSNAIIKPMVCTCGHLLSEHRGGENCEACTCVGFTPVEPVIPTTPQKCIRCGVATQYEVCEICAKAVANNFPGDLFNYLFGIRDDVGPKVGREVLPKIKAKIMAMEIRDAGVDVKMLWEFWKFKHPTQPL